jgi:hypothetical protein
MKFPDPLATVILVGCLIWIKSCHEEGIIMGFPIVVGFMCLREIWKDYQR